MLLWWQGEKGFLGDEHQASPPYAIMWTVFRTPKVIVNINRFSRFLAQNDRQDLYMCMYAFGLNHYNFVDFRAQKPKKST